MARPLKAIDADQVTVLARLHCTYTEIAAVMGCSTDTLERRFADLIDRGREEGKVSLRRLQFQKAQEGNPTMLIWLGKQHLGQVDQQQVRVGSLDTLSDEELAALAAGKVPPQLLSQG